MNAKNFFPHERSAAARARGALLSLLFALALVASPAPAAAAECPNADAAPGQASNAALAQATICLLDQQRAANGLGPLALNAPLADTAERYAAQMVATDHFAHVDLSGGNVVDRVLADDPAMGSRWEILGENLGWGTFALATPRAMVEGWMNSPEHRANVLYPNYQDVGVGIADGAPAPGVASSGALTYVTVFGKIAKPDTTTTAKRPHKRRKRSRRARAARHRAVVMRR
jgi:uncharacterized protein YkwD